MHEVHGFSIPLGSTKLSSPVYPGFFVSFPRPKDCRGASVKGGCDMAENANIDELKFQVTDEEGNVHDCDALFMFDSPFFKKSYIVYTDGAADEQGYTSLYASSYNKETLAVPADGGFASIDLEPITDDEEWAIINQQVKQYQQISMGDAAAAAGNDGSADANASDEDDDMYPLLTELAAGAKLADSFDYHFENGQVVTFFMEENPNPRNDQEKVTFKLPEAEFERMVDLFFEEQFGGYSEVDDMQVRTRQVLEAMVVSVDGNGMCTLEPQQSHVFYKHRNDALEG